MRRIPLALAFALASLTLLWFIPRGQSADEGTTDKKPAVVVVRLPAEAELTIGGIKSKQRSAVREFDTPPLAPGKKFSYTLVAVWKDGDREERFETTIIVQAGETKEINLLELKATPPPAEKIPAPELILEPVKGPEPKSQPPAEQPEPKPEPEKKPEAPKKGTLSLVLPEQLALQPGAKKLLPIKVIRTDCEGPINLKFEGLPPGIELKEATIAADKEKVYVAASATADAEENEWQIKVIGVSGPIRQAQSLKIKIAK